MEERSYEPLIFELWNDFIKASTQESLNRFDAFFTQPKAARNLMEYMYTTKAYKQSIERLSTSFVRKDYKKAFYCYMSGNLEFDKKHYKRALRHYSDCVIYAPLSPTDRLARGFAGRARVLYMIGQNKACMKEVDRALKNGYAGDSQDLERLKLMADLNIAVNNVERDVGSSDTSRDQDSLATRDRSIDQESLDSASTVDHVIEIGLPKLNTCCRDEIFLSHENEFVNLAPELKYRHLFNRGQIKEPELTLPNKNVPCLTRAAKIDYDEDKGRIIVATRGIYPGEVLIKEQVYTYAPSLESTHEVCSLCGLVAVLPIPCPTCTNIVFCNETCMAVALNRFHAMECRMLSLLYKLHPSGILVCLARMMFEKRKLSIVNHLFKYYFDERKTKGEKGFDEEGRYHSSDMRTIYNLQHNYSNMTNKQIAEACFQSLVLMELIFRETSFATNVVQDEKEEEDENKMDEKKCKEEKQELGKGAIKKNKKLKEEKKGSKKEREETKVEKKEEKKMEEFPIDEDLLSGDKMKLCLALFKLVMVSRNGFSQNSIIYDSKKQKVKAKATGGYFAPLNALLSHSCVPNAVLTDHGRDKVLRARRYIKEGEEITISYDYGGVYKTKTVEERRKALKNYFNFLCMCEICRKGDLSGVCNLKVGCPQCKIEIDENGCKKCSEKIFEIPEYIRSIAEIEGTHYTAKELIRLAPAYKAKVSTSHVLVENTQLKDMLTAQEWLKYFTIEFTDEFRRIMNKIEKNYQIRAYHTHDRRVK